MMEVKEGITVSLYDIVDNKTVEWDTFVLNEEANGGISGSRIDLDKDDFRVRGWDCKFQFYFYFAMMIAKQK